MEVGTSRRSETSEASAMEPTMEAGVGPENGAKGNLGPVVDRRRAHSGADGYLLDSGDHNR